MLGFNYPPEALLLDRQLNAGLASRLMYDWMHVYLCTGLLDVELGMHMVALKQEQSPTTYSALGD